jgi:cytochrome c556
MKTTLMLSLCALLASPAFAADDPVTARQAIFKQFKKDAAAMGKLVKADNFSKDEFSKLAMHLDAIAQQPWQHFPAGTASGKTSHETDAKAEIWSKSADWNKAVDNFKAETGKLKQVAANGDAANIKNQFGAVQKSCKSCHDAFRKD